MDHKTFCFRRCCSLFLQVTKNKITATCNFNKVSQNIIIFVFRFSFVIAINFYRIIWSNLLLLNFNTLLIEEITQEPFTLLAFEIWFKFFFVLLNIFTAITNF